MYDIVWFNSNNKKHFSVMKDGIHRMPLVGIRTLEEANNARWASGDVVVFTGTGNCVPDEAWLWEWEKNNPKSYAYKLVMRAKGTPVSPFTTV